MKMAAFEFLTLAANHLVFAAQIIPFFRSSGQSLQIRDPTVRDKRIQWPGLRVTITRSLTFYYSMS